MKTLKPVVLRDCLICDTEFEIRDRAGNHKYCSPRCKDMAKRVRFYGGTIADMKRLYAQADVCAACDGEFVRDDGWGRVMDHCHSTSKLRGILHQGCNTGLGAAGDDQEKLYSWQVYLARHQFDLVDLCRAA